MKRFLLFSFAMLLAGCMGGGKPINDFTDRSVVYGYLDVSQINGNHLFSADIRQFSPQTDNPYLGMAIKKHEGGYLIYHYGAERGNFEFNSLSLQSCLAIICSNTINQYSFSGFGDAPGKVNATRPGVHYMGAFALKKERGGLFRVGEFSVHRIAGPSKQGMLNTLLNDAPDGHPIVTQRIRAAM